MKAKKKVGRILRTRGRRRLANKAMVAARTRYSKEMRQISAQYLDFADQIFCLSSSLDTAVRDEVAEGLARIVRAAHDCSALGIEFPTTDQWLAYIDTATANWFRERGFAEWFCIAAASGFNSSRPRIADQLPFRLHNPRPRKKSKQAAKK